ncbi:DNA modification methylase [Microbacterium sp. gxy059]|uniref:DNA modification methylase n=1 Tax=Microbacterium sp. gxy059 TaxID=2957199 RepID=UPI003D96ED98
MKSRTIASLALGGVVLLTATGCGAVAPQATTFQYTPSDGVNIFDDGDSALAVRNVLVVADRDGAEGNLVATVANTGSSQERLTVDWAAGNAAITIPAGETVSLGAGDEPLLVTGLDAQPGSTVSMFFQSGDAQGTEIEIPVLDNCLEEYADLAPNDDPQGAHCEQVKEVESHH